MISRTSAKGMPAASLQSRAERHRPVRTLCAFAAAKPGKARRESAQRTQKLSSSQPIPKRFSSFPISYQTSPNVPKRFPSSSQISPNLSLIDLASNTGRFPRNYRNGNENKKLERKNMKLRTPDCHATHLPFPHFPFRAFRREPASPLVTPPPKMEITNRRIPYRVLLESYYDPTSVLLSSYSARIVILLALCPAKSQENSQNLDVFKI
jgi:hypothetical protein